MLRAGRSSSRVAAAAIAYQAATKKMAFRVLASRFDNAVFSPESSGVVFFFRSSIGAQGVATDRVFYSCLPLLILSKRPSCEIGLPKSVPVAG